MISSTPNSWCCDIIWPTPSLDYRTSASGGLRVIKSLHFPYTPCMPYMPTLTTKTTIYGIHGVYGFTVPKVNNFPGLRAKPLHLRFLPADTVHRSRTKRSTKVVPEGLRALRHDEGRVGRCNGEPKHDPCDGTGLYIYIYIGWQGPPKME